MPITSLENHRAVQLVRRFFAKPWAWPMILCAVVAGAFLDHVLTGTKPWETKWAERAAAGKGPGFNDYVHTGLWWAAVANSIIATLLALTAPIWAHRRRIAPISLRRESPETSGAGIRTSSPAKFWLVLALIVVAVALPLRLARFNHAMWADADHAFRDIIHGEYEPVDDSGDGALTFTPYDWKRTFFYDKWTNNHYLYSISARLCLDAWRGVTGAEAHEFAEWPLRLPPLLGGLLSIVAGALLLRRIGFPGAGLVLALLLALHPWHVRFSSEGRGYALLIGFFLLAIFFLIDALETGRWRSWLLFGAMEFFALYSWKAALHPFVALNLVAIGLILVHRRDLLTRRFRGEAFTQLSRLGVANHLAAIPFIWLFAPAVGQIQRKLATSLQSRGEMGLDWFQNIYSQLFGAMDWANGDPTTPFHTFAGMSGVFPAFSVFATVIFPALALAGLVLLFRRSPSLALIFLSPFAGAFIAWMHFSLTNNLLLQYYLFYTLPFLLAFFAIAVTAPLTWLFTCWKDKEAADGPQRSLLSDRPVAKMALAILALQAAAFYVAFQFPQLRLFLTFPMQEARGASAVTRTADEGRFHLGPSRIVTAGLYRVARADDPRMRDVRTPDELRTIARECDAAGKRFRVSVSNLGFARAMHGDYFALLNDERYFRSLGTFYGWKDDYTILCWEYLPGSMSP